MNVIGTRPDGWWNNPDRAVRRFIEELDRYGAATGDDITAVFDRRPPDLSAGRHGAITVTFATRRGETPPTTTSWRWWPVTPRRNPSGWSPPTGD
jgi:hypothetical protein